MDIIRNTHRRQTFLECLVVYFTDLYLKTRQPIYSLEIGVATGKFSEILIKSLQPFSHTMVDSWKIEGPSSRLDWWSDIEQEEADLAYKTLCEKYHDDSHAYNDEHLVVRETSEKYLKFAKSENFSYDLIYLDKDINAEGIYEDLHGCWNILADNGLLCGDDFSNPHYSNDINPVRDAVIAFSTDLNLPFSVIPGDNGESDQYIFHKNA